MDAMIPVILNHYNQRVFEGGQYFTDGGYIYFAQSGKLLRVVDVAVIKCMELHCKHIVLRTTGDYEDWHLTDSGAEF